MGAPIWLVKDKSWRDMTMYLAHPSRIRQFGVKMEQFAYERGFSPVNPFGCGDFKYFEGGRMGRVKTLEFGLAVQRRLCGYTGVLGISDGVMGEVKDRLVWDSQKNIRIFHDAGFDPMWDGEYNRLKSVYGDLFAELRGSRQLVVFVGPSAIGKDYWMIQLRNKFGSKIQRIRNVTTRHPRDARDAESYYFVHKDIFLKGRETGAFFESDSYLGEYYGSSLEEIRRVLKFSNGAFALTPGGARELHKCRFEINMKFILFKPTSDAVLFKNFERRGIKDQQKIKKLLEEAKLFELPDEVDHKTIRLTGTDSDKVAVFDAVSSLIK